MFLKSSTLLSLVNIMPNNVINIIINNINIMLQYYSDHSNVIRWLLYRIYKVQTAAEKNTSTFNS